MPPSSLRLGDPVWRHCLALSLVFVLSSCQSLDRPRPTWSPLTPPGAVASDRSDTVYGSPAPGIGGATPSGESRALSQPEIYLGSDQLIGSPSPGAGLRVSQDGDIALNFVDANVREVVDAVLGEALGLNYAIDSRVQGLVTVRTSRPIARADMVPVLEDILAASGAAIITTDGLYRIVPADEAAGGSGEIRFRGGPIRMDRGFGLNLFPLQHTSAESLSGVLEPFVPPGRVLRMDPQHNLLLFAGTASEAQDMQNLIEIFDVDRMAGMSFAIFPLEFAKAETLVAELQEVFGQGGAGAEGPVRFLPIERLNAILTISPQSDFIENARIWVTRLDRGEEGTGRRIHVYRVQNGRAADLAEVLAPLFLSDGEGTLAPSSARVAPGVIPAQISRPMPGETGSPVENTVSAPEVLASNEFGQVRRGGTPEPGGIDFQFGGSGGPKIVADPRNNALLIWATSDENRAIQSTLRELDILPLQTLIEATIAEVTLRDNLEYGLQWFFSSGNSSVTFSDLASGAVSPSFPGFSYVFSGGDARAVLNALSEITDVKVISSPQLMVLNNEAATLQVGDDVPVAVQQSVSVLDPDAPVVNAIEFRETGVILEVTPRVNAGGLVILDIVQEVSDVVQTTSSTLNSPTIQQRRITSTVAVQSGETIALGGLIADSTFDGVTGVPLLSDIPVLGNLFKTTVDRVERTELLILLTPRVVRSLQDARDVTQELRQRLSAWDGFGNGVEP